MRDAEPKDIGEAGFGKNFAPLGSERLGDRAADAATGACHERDTPIQTEPIAWRAPAVESGRFGHG